MQEKEEENITSHFFQAAAACQSISCLWNCSYSVYVSVSNPRTQFAKLHVYLQLKQLISCSLLIPGTALAILVWQWVWSNKPLIFFLKCIYTKYKYLQIEYR